MTYTTWLTAINEALQRVGLSAIASDAELTANTTPSAMVVNRYFDRAYEKILGDHDWRVAKRRIFLGSSTIQRTADLPVGMVEYSQAPTRAGGFITGTTYYITTIGTTDFTLIGAASNTVGKVFTATGPGSGSGTATVAPTSESYLPIPAYDPTGVAAGSVAFEIMRVIDIENVDPSNWVEKGRNIYILSDQVTGFNFYANVYYKPTAAEAAKDQFLTEAVKLQLCLMIAPPVTGKDTTRDTIIRSELQACLAQARNYDNNLDNPEVNGPGFWAKRAGSTKALYNGRDFIGYGS